MKSLFILWLAFFIQPFPGKPGFIDPTGTYILTGTIKNNRITGHSGELRVRLLEDHTVAVCFYINKGYPGYESGSFIDTLTYEENRIYYTPGKASSCTVLFSFADREVAITQIYSDPHSGCGFGGGVLIPATFRKTSGDIPIIQDLSLHGAAHTPT